MILARRFPSATFMCPSQAALMAKLKTTTKCLCTTDAYNRLPLHKGHLQTSFVFPDNTTMTWRFSEDELCFQMLRIQRVKTTLPTTGFELINLHEMPGQCPHHMATLATSGLILRTMVASSIMNYVLKWQH